MYNLLDSDAIGNGVRGILTAFKHNSGHVSCSGTSDLIIRILNRFQLALTTFRLSPDTICPTVLVVHSSYHQPTKNRQPHSVLIADMSVRACHIGGYGLIYLLVTSVTSARLCPAY
ncbi:hypothetical protein AMTRI_Chr13g124210 [Amborella trichopoda]